MALNFRGVTLHPSPERDVIDRNPAFGQEFLDVAIAIAGIDFFNISGKPRAKPGETTIRSVLALKARDGM